MQLIFKTLPKLTWKNLEFELNFSTGSSKKAATTKHNYHISETFKLTKGLLFCSIHYLKNIFFKLYYVLVFAGFWKHEHVNACVTHFGKPIPLKVIFNIITMI